MITKSPFFLVVYLVGIFLVVDPAYGLTKGAALQAYGKGERLAASGNTSAAIKEFEKAVRLAPSNPGMRTHLAWLLLEQGRPREAIPHFKVLLTQKPDLKDAISGLALAETQLGNLDAALSTLEQGLSYYPRDAQLLRQKAEVLAARPKTAPLALTVYDELLRLEPKNADWLNRRRQAASQQVAAQDYAQAEIYLKRGDRQSALRELEKAIRFNPESLGYRIHYGWVLVEAGNPALAARTFEEVLTRDPKQYEALRGLAWARMGQGDSEAALAAARQGLEYYPNDEQLLEVMADAAAARKATYKLAEDTYQSLLARKPKDVARQIKYAKLLMAEWQLDRAAQIFREILSAEPGNTEARLGMAKIDMDSQYFGGARGKYEAVLAAAPENPEAQQGLQRAQEFLRPQVQTYGGYLRDSQTFTRSHIYSSFRYYLTDYLTATTGYGYLVYDKNNTSSGPLMEREIHRHVLPLQLQYRPDRNLIVEASGAFSNFGNTANSAEARASLYYQMTQDRGAYLYYSYYDVIDPSGPFNGPWGRHLDNFPDFTRYRYWITDPVSAWAQNIYGSSSTLSIMQHIRANEGGLWAYQDLFGRLTFSAYGALSSYTDANFRKTTTLEASYRVVTDPLLLKLVYSFYYLGYRSRSATLQGLPPGSVQLYFDPIAFKNHSWGVVLEKNLNDWLKFSMQTAIQLTPGAPSPGFLALGEMDVLLTKQLALRTVAFYSTSANSDSTTYQVRSVTGGLSYRF